MTTEGTMFLQYVIKMVFWTMLHKDKKWAFNSKHLSPFADEITIHVGSDYIVRKMINLYCYCINLNAASYGGDRNNKNTQCKYTVLGTHHELICYNNLNRLWPSL